MNSVDLFGGVVVDVGFLKDLWQLVVDRRRQCLACWKGAADEDPDPFEDQSDGQQEDHAPVPGGNVEGHCGDG